MPENWVAGKMKGSKEEAKTFNGSIDRLVANLYQCYNALLQEGSDITAESLRNAFCGKGERARYLVEIFEEHNANLEQLIGKIMLNPRSLNMPLL